MKDCVPDVIEKVKSGIIHIVHVLDGERVSSGTGFMVNGYLVTNYHVIYDAPDRSKIVLKTYNSNPNNLLEGVIELERDIHGKFSGDTNKGYKNEGCNFIKKSSEKNKYDYIIFNIPELKESDLFSFQLDSYKSKKVGEEILFIGYHLDYNHIVSHRGFISSFYNSNGVDKIQIDASVNSGNSGSPLIDPNTSKVIGIVTRKETGLLKDDFDQLRSLTRKYQEQLPNFPSSTSIMVRNSSGFHDLLYENSKRNAQIYELIRNIERSANVGIGYAYSVEHLYEARLSY